jgi:hypothetical protein
VLAQVTASLELDSLSAFYFEGAGVGAMIPSVTVPIEIRKVTASTWDLRVRAADFVLPEIVYPSRKRVAWKLAADATGAFAVSGSEVVCQLTAPAIAYVDGSASGIPMTLTFSTEALSASAKGFTAQRQGVRLDPASGYLQLVTASVNPLHAATAPGNPFFAVLSGRIVGFSFQ